MGVLSPTLPFPKIFYHLRAEVGVNGMPNGKVYSGSITQRVKQVAISTVTDPVKVGAIAVGAIIAAPISLAVDKLLYDGWSWGFNAPGLKSGKVPVVNWDVPYPAMVEYKWQLIQKVRGKPKDEFDRSLTAGIIGTVISGGVSTIVYTKLDKEIGKLMAVGAGLSLVGFIIKGLIQWGTAGVEDIANIPAKAKKAFENKITKDKWVVNPQNVEYNIHQDAATKLWQIRVKVAQYPNNDPRIGQSFIVAYLVRDKSEAFYTAQAITPAILDQARTNPTKGNNPAIQATKPAELMSPSTDISPQDKKVLESKIVNDAWVKNPQGVEYNLHLDSVSKKWQVRVKVAQYPKNDPKLGQSFIVAYLIPSKIDAYNKAMAITSSILLEIRLKGKKGGVPALSGYGRLVYNSRYGSLIYPSMYGDKIVHGELMIGDVPASIIAFGREGSVI
jgi:hypothetical protein